MSEEFMNILCSGCGVEYNIEFPECDCDLEESSSSDGGIFPMTENCAMCGRETWLDCQSFCHKCDLYVYNLNEIYSHNLPEVNINRADYIECVEYLRQFTHGRYLHDLYIRSFP
jgi:hypothetical protein